MNWRYEGPGYWEADSEMHDGGCPFSWRITAMEDGDFSTADSDSELISDKHSFETLAAAKEWCENQEKLMVALSGNSPRSSTETLISALRHLSNDIQSDDGIANAVCAEAAMRLEEYIGRSNQ